MVSGIRWVAPALLLAGVGLLVASVLAGNAHAALVVIFPVVTGSSAGFLAGLLLVVLGLLALPLTVSVGADPDPRRGDEVEEAGGVLLFGPIPIFVGGWKGAGRRAYGAWALVGLVLSVLAVVVFLLWLPRP